MEEQIGAAKKSLSSGEKKGSWGVLLLWDPKTYRQIMPNKSTGSCHFNWSKIYKMPCAFLGSYWKKKGVTQLHFVLTDHNLFLLEGDVLECEKDLGRWEEEMLPME